METLGSYDKRFTVAFRKDITDKLLNDWYTLENTKARMGAMKFWQAIRENAKNERPRFYDRLLEYATQKINENELHTDVNKIYFETSNE